MSTVDVHIDSEMTDMIVFVFHAYWNFADFRSAMLESRQLMPIDKVRAFIIDMREPESSTLPPNAISGVRAAFKDINDTKMTYLVGATGFVKNMVQVFETIMPRFRSMFRNVRTMEEARLLAAELAVH